MVVYFDDNDEQFLRWTKSNPNGYVVNMHRQPKLRYVVLHRANCSTLKTHRNAD